MRRACLNVVTSGAVVMALLTTGTIWVAVAALVAIVGLILDMRLRRAAR